MTHVKNSSAMTEIMELLTANGLEGMTSVMRIRLNEAMKADRAITDFKCLMWRREGLMSPYGSRITCAR